MTAAAVGAAELCVEGTSADNRNNAVKVVAGGFCGEKTSAARKDQPRT
jgi:hypothetical protein